jgi:uncharacterized protein YndB with AHSA1/START domain
MDDTEYGTIEREIHVDAAPDVVFEVVSRPEHIREWWPDDARFEPIAGESGELIWRDADTGETTAVELQVLEVDRPVRFSFRWCFSEPGCAGESLLVTFELTPTPTGTHLRMTESGFRAMGWEVAVLEANYQDHVQGWNHFIPRLGEYVARLVATR